MTTKIPAGAKYVVMGYYEDEQDEEFPIKYFKDRESAHTYAFDFEADHDGIIRTFVKTIEHKTSTTPAVKKTVVKKAVKKNTVEKTATNGYALMYKAHPEDIEMGEDKNHWFKFKYNDKVVTHFPTLEELLKVVMTYLKPTKEYKMGDIYKTENRKNNYYGELQIITYPYEVEGMYYANGKKVAVGTTVLWRMLKRKNDVEFKTWAVDKTGKRTEVYRKKE